MHCWPAGVTQLVMQKKDIQKRPCEGNALTPRPFFVGLRRRIGIYTRITAYSIIQLHSHYKITEAVYQLIPFESHQLTKTRHYL